MPRARRRARERPRDGNGPLLELASRLASVTLCLRGLSSFLALNADDLAEAVDDLDEVALRFHHGLDGLVGGRRLVDHAGVLPALDALRRLLVIGDREPPLGLRARHGASGAV